MARAKNKSQDNEPKDEALKDDMPKEETQTAEQAEQVNPAENAEMEAVTAVGVSVKLKAIHPGESYGRAGYRFNKVEEKDIELNQLNDAQLDELTADPWLEVVFITDK